MAGFLETQALQQFTFSGGRVDDAAMAKPDQYVKMDNFLLGPGGKPYLRAASDFFTSSASGPGAATRIIHLTDYDSGTSLLACQGTDLYRAASGATSFTAISGTGTGAQTLGAFRGCSGSQLVQSAEWNKHTFFTMNEAVPPAVAYYTGSLWKVRTAGLPAIAETENYVSATLLASAISLANTLRTKMIDHFTDATDNMHEFNDTVANAMLGSASTNLATLLVLTGELSRAWKAHIDDMYRPDPEYHWYGVAEGPSPLGGNQAQVYHGFEFLPDRISTPADLTEAVDALNDLYIKFYIHSTYSVQWDFHNNTAITGANAISATLRLTPPTTGPQMNRTYDWFTKLVNRFQLAFEDHLEDTNIHSGATSFTPITADILNLRLSSNFSTSVPLDYLLNYLVSTYDAHDQDAETNGAAHARAESANNSLPGVEPSLGPLVRFARILATAPQPVATLAQCMDLYGYLVTAHNAHDKDKYDGTGAHNASSSGDYGVYQGEIELPEVGNYLYGFHYSYTYTVDGVEYEDAGPVLLRTLEDALPPNIEPHIITKIPMLANTSAQNYDTSTTLKIKIFRSSRNGSTLYLVGQVDNDPTTYPTGASYTDRTSDEDLVAGETVYITGGVVDNDPPPMAKYIHVVNDFAYYGYQLDPTEVVPQRIRQSIQGDLDACPGDFYVDLPNSVAGLSSAKGVPLGFTTKGVYRLEGSYNEVGQGALLAVPVSETVGLKGNYSPVVIDDGCVFAGTDGFYFTDGYNLTCLSKGWRRSYQKLIATAAKAQNIRGAYDSYMGRVWWSASDTLEGDHLVVLDLNFGLKDNAVFTTISNASNEFFIVKSLCFYDGRLVRGNDDGAVLYHGVDDQTLSTSFAQDALSGVNVRYPAEIQGPLFDFGTTQLRKWTPKVSASFTTFGQDVAAKFVMLDDKSNFFTLPHVTYTGDNVTTLPTLVEETRRMRAGGFRCNRRQMRLSNASVVSKSDTLGLASISGTTLTIAAGTWPAFSSPREIRIYFSTDNYKTAYRTNSNGGTSSITLTSAPGNATGVSWVIERPGAERWFLDNYQIFFGYIGGSLEDGTSETTGNQP